MNTMYLNDEETNLIFLYQRDTREATIANLEQMRGATAEDETGLRDLTDQTLKKLRAMSDDDFAGLDLVPTLDEIDG